MKFALVSDDFETITGKTGRARKFLVYEATESVEPTLLQKLEVPETQPTFHDLHDDDITPHPLDQSILITAEAGVGLKERLSRRGITVYITSETNPLVAINGVIKGNLSTLEPTPHKEDGSCLNH